MVDDTVADFEEAAKQSWQSFSTMKRFVCEANRLENASWRLWFMQKHHNSIKSTKDNSTMRKSKSMTSLAHSGGGGDPQDAKAPSPTMASMKKHSYRSYGSSSSSEDPQYRHDDVALPMCVYCEIHTAHLSCNGCCHDAYCVSCFKLIHKKGNLATHTAIKIKDLLIRRSSERIDASDEEQQTTSASDESNMEAPDMSRSAPSPTVIPAAKPSSNPRTKPWEIQMDMLIQRLMMNSMHTDGDISVHNIDSRESFAAESVASYMSDTASEDTPVVSNAKESHAMDMDWDDEVQLSNRAVVAAAVLVAGRHQKRTLSFDGMSSGNDTDSNGASSPTSPSMSPAFGSLTMPEMPPLPTSLFPPSLPRTKSKKKNSVCQNCNGNHITIDCPLLANTLPPGTPMQGAGGSSTGVDTVLRKCFTTLHNDNLSNSTHAFLGDEISVRGGSNFSKSQWTSGRLSSPGETSSWSSFGMNSISEDQSADVEDTVAVLLPLTVSSAYPNGTDEHKWDCNSWLISSLATELPRDVYETVRTTEKSCKDPLAHAHFETNRQHSLASWVFIKEPGQTWCKRYLSLYRNSLWEFLDDKDTSRPIGYANLSEGSVHSHQRTTLEFSLKYYRHSSQISAQNECWLQFESEKDAMVWREHLTRVTKLQIDDLFDLAPDALTKPSDSYELGKGRFSVVRRACRKQAAASPTSSSSSKARQDCALKIIDKNVFWDLVAHETEREDTVIREILTQSLLTVRSASSYCPVIRLLSLFETRNLLVMELELMQEGDLHEEIVTNSAVDEMRASYLVASLVKAIQYCLQNGVAHRDVKLSNLALDYGHCPKGK
uniref:Protein kinase domain-containing protein n=1 Tax=Globisporangium ultimum (strain ATCC 200006 / CBS 805.95 / DAOM BR144) TaxID=431595 RepID=K3X5T8_GLOUD